MSQDQVSVDARELANFAVNMDDRNTLTPPDYLGGSLVNLMAELEYRLTGSAAAPRLHDHLAAQIPDGQTYVVLLMDGLGADQIGHPNATSLAKAQHATLDAPFPTTTTVSLATVATGLVPIEHGLLGHIIWLPEKEMVVNSLKWISPGGAPVNVDTTTYLPSPNLWERVSAAGAEPITVQPGHFAQTPLTKCLYRGCRFEGIWNGDEFTNAVVELAAIGNRLIFGYLPEVDFAAHLYGQESGEYAEAIRTVTAAWDAISNRLPANVTLIGTADHGHIDYPQDGKFFVDRSTSASLTLFGDPRALYAKGSEDAISSFEAVAPATWYPQETMMSWLGLSKEVSPTVVDRMPDGVFLADPGHVLIPGHMDKRLVGYHGGLDPRELKIPLLVAQST